MPLYAATILVSAFLLFQVQPIIAKMILPWFGGSAGVWTACMLFFQLLLLGGYAYAHWSIRTLRARTQTALHVTLLAASVVMLPIVPNAGWKPAGNEDPTLRIFGLLAATIGLPYFLLSTTGPLLQAWFARDPRTAGRSPYRLYSLSNAGSMLALLSYPILVEPYLPTRVQAGVWSATYGLFLVLCAAAAWRAWRSGGEAAGAVSVDSAVMAPPPDIKLRLLWIGLAACASSLLLAVTNHISQNVAAIPFLWVLPLSIYLLTFILCFDSDGWYSRDWFLMLLGVALGSMAYGLASDSENLPLKVGAPLFAGGLFVACMVCHGELARLKPDPRHLTAFFLMVSIGGALGGVFVGIVAPIFFPSYWEMPISLVACGALVLIVLWRDPDSPFYHARFEMDWLLSVGLLLVMAGYLFHESANWIADARVAVRNFYGGLKVRDDDGLRVLTHGTINHGHQYLDAVRRHQATTYYPPSSGVGIAITQRAARGAVNVGVIGLGTGTLATYGRAGDKYVFYEINPLVLDLARSQFTFLGDSGAKIDVVLGDARLSLEREPPRGFDVLAVDAFSSDAIPVHLLTEEAFRLYFRHLKPDGILAVHVSNKFLDLRPIVALSCRAVGKQARQVDTEDEDGKGIFGSTWVLVTADAAFFESKEIKPAIAKLEPAQPGLRGWTDDYSNLYRILK